MDAKRLSRAKPGSRFMQCVKKKSPDSVCRSALQPLWLLTLSARTEGAFQRFLWGCEPIYGRCHIAVEQIHTLLEQV
jgi:hypothetical protein